MTPAGWPSYLEYGDAEQVRLNVVAIIAEGARVRRKRRLAKAAAAALVCGIVPAAVIIATTRAASDTTVAAGAVKAGATRFSTERFGINLVQSSVRTSVRLPHRYQRVSSLVGDLARPGVWFWGATSSRISLFHLNRNGALKTWPVLPLTGRPRTGSASGFAVTATGVAWLGLNSTLIRIETRTGQVRR